MNTSAFATRLPEDVARTLEDVCRRLGLRKNFVVEAALREKIEDLLDREDLREAVAEETRFHSWNRVRGKRRGRAR